MKELLLFPATSDNLINIMLNKRSQTKRLYTVWFRLEVQKQAKPNFGIRSQDNGYLWRKMWIMTRKEVLPSGGECSGFRFGRWWYGGVHLVKIHQAVQLSFVHFFWLASPTRLEVHLALSCLGWLLRGQFRRFSSAMCTCCPPRASTGMVSQWQQRGTKGSSRCSSPYQAITVANILLAKASQMVETRIKGLAGYASHGGQTLAAQFRSEGYGDRDDDEHNLPTVWE